MNRVVLDLGRGCCGGVVFGGGGGGGWGCCGTGGCYSRLRCRFRRLFAIGRGYRCSSRCTFGVTQGAGDATVVPNG